MAEPIRLNKYLAQLGIASRRKADEMITQGRVSIDGETVRTLGVKVDPSSQEIAVDHVPVDKPPSRKDFWAFYKPKNVVTTLKDPEKRPCVGDWVDQMKTHVFPVGRLDFDAEGLLLLTNDGELSNRLLHPRYHVVKTYRIKVKGHPDNLILKKLRSGVKLEDGFIKPKTVKIEKQLKENSWMIIQVTEGRKHLVKRMCLRIGHPVIRLIRVGFGPLTVQDLKPGQMRKLTPQEIKELRG